MIHIILLLLSLTLPLSAINKKIVICGAAQNIAESFDYTKRNMEMLGEHFSEYKIVIYENNSEDITPYLLENWADNNPNVLIKSENIPNDKLAKARTERIADARNKILKEVRPYWDFDYLLMADLDFTCDWPIQELLEVVKSPSEWDCVSSNGVDVHGSYVDKYALRSREYPFGPELLGFEWWQMVKDLRFELTGEEWLPVYSAFGGLAIYQMESIRGCYYSGSTTGDVKALYHKIIAETDRTNVHWLMYLAKIGHCGSGYIPVVFTYNTSWEHAPNHLLVTCCEHIGLHAAMHKNGKAKFYVNPKMKMYY